MGSTYQRTIALLIVLLFLSSCAQPGPGNGPDTRSEDAKRTEAEGTGFGALVGGLLGAAAGAAVSPHSRGRGAAIGFVGGAILGGIAGNMYGKSVAERKQHYANAEDRLNGEINVLRDYNADLEERNNICFQEIQDLKSRRKNLHASSEAVRKKAYLSSQEKERLDKTVQTNDTDLADYREELQALTEYKDELANNGEQASNGEQAKPEVAQLEKEIVLLRKHINTLDSNNKQMAKLAENLSVRR